MDSTQLEGNQSRKRPVPLPFPSLGSISTPGDNGNGAELATKFLEDGNDGIDWNDPDLINDPDALLKMKFDEPLIQVASSPTFAQSCQFQMEIMLQDAALFLDQFETEGMPSQSSGDLDIFEWRDMAEGISVEMEKAVKIIEACNAKPFWKKLPAQVQDDFKQHVKEWMNVLDKFGKVYGEATRIRRSKRASLFGTKDHCDEMEIKQLVQELIKINEELSNMSKVFD